MSKDGQLIHIGKFSVCLLERVGNAYKCNGCNSLIADENRFKTLGNECHRCGATVWYYYGGQMKKRNIQELREIKLGKDNISGLNFAAFFIQAYEKNTKDVIPSSDASIYPAFGDYWDSKVPRAVETICTTAFHDDDEGMESYIRFLVSTCMSNDDASWKLISDVELADSFAYNRKARSY